jgi:hypothetical protein
MHQREDLWLIRRPFEQRAIHSQRLGETRLLHEADVLADDPPAGGRLARGLSQQDPDRLIDLVC